MTAVPTSTEEWSRDDSRIFKLSEIRAATNGFSDANKLGQGGFGTVYKVNDPCNFYLKKNQSSEVSKFRLYLIRGSWRVDSKSQ